jgi:hypothetical protein
MKVTIHFTHQFKGARLAVDHPYNWEQPAEDGILTRYHAVFQQACASAQLGDATADHNSGASSRFPR